MSAGGSVDRKEDKQCETLHDVSRASKLAASFCARRLTWRADDSSETSYASRSPERMMRLQEFSILKGCITPSIWLKIVAYSWEDVSVFSFLSVMDHRYLKWRLVSRTISCPCTGFLPPRKDLMTSGFNGSATLPKIAGWRNRRRQCETTTKQKAGRLK
jgi:hypothetical protein